MSTALEGRPIQVLVADMDGLLAGFVAQALESHPDILLQQQPARPLSIVGRAAPIADVVITSLTGSSPEWWQREQFFGETGVPLLAISADRTRVHVYDRWDVREVELPQIVAAIREVARHRDHRATDTQSQPNR